MKASMIVRDRGHLYVEMRRKETDSADDNMRRNIFLEWEQRSMAGRFWRKFLYGVLLVGVTAREAEWTGALFFPPQGNAKAGAGMA